MRNLIEIKPVQQGKAARLLATASLAAAATFGLGGEASALVVRDDVGTANAVDTNNEFAGVGMMWNRVLNPNGTVSTYVCTGQLINPRTVIFAQHCTADHFDEDYDAGAGSHMGFSFDPLDAFTGFDDWRRDANGAINNPFTGVFESDPDALFYNVLQVKSVFNVSEFFPGGDVVMASFDTPVIGLPTYGMLFSPLLESTHATQVGYGTNGIGSTGDIGGIDYKRRVGENMIDGLFSQNDFLAAEFGVPGFGFGTADSAQLLYHVDFDNPNRDPDNCQRGEFFGTGNGNDILCFSGPYALDSFGDPLVFTLDGSSGVLVDDQINWYGGDALARESGTAGGDSGSALFADQIAERPLITGVLSGGWVTGVASPFGGYGDVAYYNPLFLFRDWIVENNPYIYASALAGNGNWSDPAHWVQNMDPNYFYIDRFGRVRNGLPEAPQPGYFADAPKWGTVFDTDVSGGYGDPGPDAFLADLSASPGVTDAGVGKFDDGEAGVYAQPQASTAQGVGPTASSGAPTGPGSREFVPNNDFGTYGSWTGSADGIARFYDVTLRSAGITTVDMDVEIDNLTMDGQGAALLIDGERNFNSLVAVDHARGVVVVNGHLTTREYMLWGGFLGGQGAITAQTVYNVHGALSPGALSRPGELTIEGDYVQTERGGLMIDVRRTTRGLDYDHLQVDGAASLDGLVAIVPENGFSRSRYGDVYTVLSATDGVVGNFGGVVLGNTGPVLYGESIVQANGDVDVVVQARALASLYANSENYRSLAGALDTLRFGGDYAKLQGVFDVIDSSSFATLDSAMFSLTPANAWQMTPLAISYVQGFTQGLNTRTAELRSGQRGVSNASIAAGQRIAMAGAGDQEAAALSTSTAGAPLQMGERFGLFVSGRGNLSNLGAERYEGDRYNPASLTALSSADLTVGADYRVSENFAIGVASSFSRYVAQLDATRPLDHSGYGVMAYASAWDGAWFADSYVGVARQDYVTSRLPGASAAQLTQSAPGAVQTLAGARVGWMAEPIAGLMIGPSLAVNHTRLGFDRYAETGGGDFALDFAARTLTSTTVETALEFTYQGAVGASASPFAAFGRLGLATEIGDGVEVITARFLAAPDAAFDIERTLDRQWMTGAAGFSYRLGQDTSAYLEANQDAGRGDYSNSSVMVGFNHRF